MDLNPSITKEYFQRELCECAIIPLIAYVTIVVCYKLIFEWISVMTIESIRRIVSEHC